MYKILSIVIPTYNVQEYLHKCLSSLVIDDEVLMNMLEVIVVNDGSTDTSSEIAHKFESLYPLVYRVIDKDNGNYGSCVNLGLKEAKGKYIKVLDADDWFETEQFVIFLNHLSKLDVDLVINDMDKVNPQNGQEEIFVYSLTPYKITDMSALSHDYHRMWMHAVTYKTDMLRQIGYRQTEGISYTDQEWIFLPFAAAQKVYYVPGVLYHYLVGREGQTVSFKSQEKNFWMLIKGLCVMAEEWHQATNNNGSINGHTLNMDYLLSRLLVRSNNVYSFLLNYDSFLSSYQSQINEFETYLSKEMPWLYDKIENICYPDISPKRLIPSAHYIRTWHRHGLMMCKLQLWFMNHYMGLISRISRA